MIATNSMSKITKIIAIIKNWFENLKFFSDIELNPHSTLEFIEKFDLNFCLSKNIIKVRSITIKIEIKIWILGKISEWEKSLFYRIRINLFANW